ncbi:hypothetical protein HPB47_012797 [Ixodes persulcatus]|uniref:Uncharacterized protein n=1 Tax=Ixodes persulcatus TaxID=34615 RepID=A0AC60NSI7_IXOPE|nr:hypothetical protein HPB47_012797 [Ixodes persulcatus]
MDHGVRYKPAKANSMPCGCHVTFGRGGHRQHNEVTPALNSPGNIRLMCRVSLAMAHSEADLERQAMEEILRESKRGAERAKESGAYGWERPRLHPTNKVFLRNTVLSTLPSRRRLQSSSKTSVKDRASNGRAESEHRKRERRDSPGKSETDKKRRDEDGRPVSKAQSTRAK